MYGVSTPELSMSCMESERKTSGLHAIAVLGQSPADPAYDLCQISSPGNSAVEQLVP